ncbi:MAG: hypothetical protein QOH82_3133 [Mycobacterium sp.]|nr:hypothetical protein [Mycobacterium sp.]
MGSTPGSGQPHEPPAPTPGDPPTPEEPATAVDCVVDDEDDSAAQPPAPADEPVDECADLDGVPPPRFTKPLLEMTLTEALTDTDPGYLSTIPPAVMMGGLLLPGAVARRAARGATLRLIVHPGQAPPEPRHTPSAALADFVRARDLTCRFPGCTVAATRCDVDHTIPWPYGPTSASNLKCLCRTNHLLKTFWGGPDGWRERQLPDGTVHWTAPDGGTYTTTPGSRLLFPSLCEPTAPVIATTVPTHTSGLTMPRRQCTRAEDRAYRIQYERELNQHDS